jgi:hypothetical protein
MFDIEAIKKQFEGLELPNFKAYTEEEVKAKNRNNKAPFGIDTVFQSPKQILENIKGIVFDMSNEDYHGTKEYDSSSRIKAVNISELHYKDYGKNKVNTKSMDFGTLLHDDIEHRTKTGEWKAIEEETRKTKCHTTETAIVLHPTLHNWVLTYRKEMERHPILSQILNKAVSEASFFHDSDDSDPDHKKKVRADEIIHEPIENALHIFDWKYTNSFDWFHNDIKKFQYNLSAGMYSHIISKVTGLKTYFHLVKIDAKTGLIQIVQVKYDTLLKYQELYFDALKKIDGIDLDNPKSYDFDLI